MQPPIKVVLQRHDWDCTIAALASITHSEYEEVLAVAAREANVEGRGLYIKQIEAVAEELDAPLSRRRKGRYDIHTATGILVVENKKRKHYHVVVLWQGRIIETDGTLWLPEDYFVATKFAPGTLLVRE